MEGPGGWARRGRPSAQAADTPRCLSSVARQPAAFFCCEATQNKRMTFLWETHTLFSAECMWIVGIICVQLSCQIVLGSDSGSPTY